MGPSVAEETRVEAPSSTTVDPEEQPPAPAVDLSEANGTMNSPAPVPLSKANEIIQSRKCEMCGEPVGGAEELMAHLQAKHNFQLHSPVNAALPPVLLNEEEEDTGMPVIIKLEPLDVEEMEESEFSTQHIEPTPGTSSQANPNPNMANDVELKREKVNEFTAGQPQSSATVTSSKGQLASTNQKSQPQATNHNFSSTSILTVESEDYDASHPSPSFEKREPDKDHIECPHCFEHFPKADRAAYRIHLTPLPRGKDNYCPLCVKNYRCRNGNAYHFRDLEANQNVLFKCTKPGCIYVFVNKDCLLYHETTNHDEDENKTEPNLKKQRKSSPTKAESTEEISVVGGRFTCEVCYKSYSTNGNLHKHMKKCAPELLPNPLHVPEGRKPIIVKSELAKAQTVRENDGSDRICPFCGLSFSRKWNLKEHIQKLHAHSERPYKCRICAQLFTTAGYLKRHHGQAHFGSPFEPSKILNVKRESPKSKPKPQQPIVIKTDFTPRASTSAGIVRTIAKKFTTDLSDPTKPYVCKTCTHTFVSRGNVRRHINQVHKEVTFDENAYFKRQVHSQPKPRPHQPAVKTEVPSTSKRSPEHSKPSQNVSNVIDPITLHNLQVCQLCCKVYTTFGYLKRHCRQAHRELDLKQIIAMKTISKAPKVSVKTEVKFKPHNPSPDPSKPHKCQICGRAFRQSGNLKRHYQTVHKEMDLGQSSSVKREVPSSSTNAQQPRVKAEQEVDPSRIYKCQVCPKAFTAPVNLSRHFKQAHRGMDMDQDIILEREVPSRPQKSKVKAEPLPRQVDTSALHKCRICPTAFFTTEVNLRRHCAMVHRGMDLGQSQSINMTREVPSGSTNPQKPRVKTELPPGKFDTPVLHKCQICSRAFIGVGHLKRHMTMEHKGVDMSQIHTVKRESSATFTFYQCTLCPRAFIALGNLNRHCRKNHGGEGVQLNQPTPVQQSTSRPQNPQKSKVKTEVPPREFETPKRHKCQVCPQSFTRAWDARRHFERNHKDVGPDIILDMEVQSKIQKPKIKTEPLPRYLDSSRLFKCQICPRGFTTAANLKRHGLTVHKDIDLEHSIIVKREGPPQPQPPREFDTSALYKCKICPNRFFTTEVNLRRHCAMVHKGMDLGHSHSQNINMTREVPSTSTNAQKPRVKAEQPPRELDTSGLFKCKICPRAFTEVGTLKRHITVAHKKNKKNLDQTTIVKKEGQSSSDLNLTLHKCRLCPRAFTSSGNLNRHYRTNHDGVEISQTTPSKSGVQQYKLSKPRYRKPVILPESPPKIYGPSKTSGRMICISSFKEEKVVIGKSRTTSPKKRKREEETVNCEYCSKLQSNIWNYKRHVKSLHPKENWRSIETRKVRRLDL